MKTTILILNTNEWEFESNSGKMTGTSARFLMEELDKVHSSTIKEEYLKLVTSTKLPALFEVDLSPKVQTFEGKSNLKFSITSFKFLKEIPVFKA